MTLRALIIDDEPLAHRVILEYARDLPQLEIVGQYYLATEALAALAKNTVDLIFLDIQMPKLTGLEFLRSLRHPPLVIVTSAYAEYAAEGFELDVCDYLVKPFRLDRFLKAVNKAVAWKNRSTVRPAPAATATETDAISLKVDKKTLRLRTAEIEYLESYGNYVKVWVDGSALLTPTTLTQLHAALPAARFMRIHKSYVVNIDRIAYLEGRQLGMQRGKVLPVGKLYFSEVRDWMGR